MNRRALLCAATALAALSLAACGGGGAGGDGGGGGGGGEGSAGLLADANQAQALLQDVQGLSSSSTPQQLATTLTQLQSRLQTLIEDVKDTDVPDELKGARDKLVDRLAALRTALGSALGAASSGEAEAAVARATNMVTIDDIQDAINQALDAAG